MTLALDLDLYNHVRRNAQDWQAYKEKVARFVELSKKRMTTEVLAEYEETVADELSRDADNTFVKLTIRSLLMSGVSEDTVRGMVVLLFS